LIDYGFVKNKKDKLSVKNKELYNKFLYIESKLVFIKFLLCNYDEFFNYLNVNKIIFNYDKQFNIFMKSEEYKIVKYLADCDYVDCDYDRF